MQQLWTDFESGRNMNSQTSQRSRELGAKGLNAWGWTHTSALSASQPRNKAFDPTPEQESIIELCKRHNVVVTARPGSGKTATALGVVESLPEGSRALTVTFSRTLKTEKEKRMDPSRCDVMTFHKLAKEMFQVNVPDDKTLRELRAQGRKPTWSFPAYSAIILDEMQDCTEILFWLIAKLLVSLSQFRNGIFPRLIILGDERQAIHGFRGADARYLTRSSEMISSLSPHPWEHVTLNKSFRLSYETAEFINHVCLGGQKYLVGSKRGPKPVYVHCDIENHESLTKLLISYIQRYGVENTGIINHSVRNSMPLAGLTGELSSESFYIASPNIHDPLINKDILRGKIYVSTPHQFKGSERDLVIVYGLDAGFLKWMKNEVSANTLPNSFFVALTRARRQLIVLHDEREKQMPFAGDLADTVEFVNLSKHKMKPRAEIAPAREFSPLKRVSVSDAPRFVNDIALEALVNTHLKVEKNHVKPFPPEQHIKIPEKVLTRKLERCYEAVRDISRTAILSAYEYRLKGTLCTMRIQEAKTPKLPLTDTGLSMALCRFASSYHARLSGFRFRSNQMTDYHFRYLAPYLEQAVERVKIPGVSEKYLAFNKKLERPASPLAIEVPWADGEEQRPILARAKLHGRADIIQSPRDGAAQTVIWEINYDPGFSLEDVARACLKAYLWCHTEGIQPEADPSQVPTIRLLSIRDGAQWKVDPVDGVKSLTAFVEGLLRAKYGPKEKVSDEEFLERCELAKEDALQLWGDGGEKK